MATYVTDGQGVAAGRGWDWIASGWELFKKQAGMWIALVLVAFVIFFVLAMIPVVGSLATFVLSPVFAAGVLAGSRAVDEGRGLEIGHLFAGFREKLAPLATVGAIYLGAAVVIALGVGLATGASIFTMMDTAGEAATPAAAHGRCQEEPAQMPILIVLAFILVLDAIVIAGPAGERQAHEEPATPAAA